MAENSGRHKGQKRLVQSSAKFANVSHQGLNLGVGQVSVGHHRSAAPNRLCAVSNDRPDRFVLR